MLCLIWCIYYSLLKETEPPFPHLPPAAYSLFGLCVSSSHFKATGQTSPALLSDVISCIFFYFYFFTAFSAYLKLTPELEIDAITDARVGKIEN